MAERSKMKRLSAHDSNSSGFHSAERFQDLNIDVSRLVVITLVFVPNEGFNLGAYVFLTSLIVLLTSPQLYNIYD